MRVTFLMILIVLSFASWSQTEEFTLQNGLKVIVKEDHRSPVVVSMVWYDVGSADEPGGITGVSHALEHLMFKGTSKYPLGMFSKTIAQLGGQENAFTSNDYTAYYEKTAAQHLEKNLELEADRMTGLLLDEQEFGREIKVIQEERRLRTDDNPQALAFERFLSTAHLASPYHHPVIGWMGDLEQMQVSDARDWYKRYYAPNNATLVVVGDVTPSSVHTLAQKYFSHLTPQPKIPRKLQTEPPNLGQKTVEVQTQAQLPVLMLGYTVPSAKAVTGKDDIEPYALEILAYILGAENSGRLSKDLVRNKQIASSADAYYNLHARYQTQFIVYGIPTQNHTIEELKAALLEEIKHIQSEPITDQELRRIKNQIVAQKTFERDSIFAQAMELGLLETVGLGWQTAEQYIPRIQSVTADQLQKAAQHYFKEEYITQARLIPIHSVKRPS